MINIFVAISIFLFGYVLYTLYTTASYLRFEYKKALAYYTKKQRAKRNFRSLKKEEHFRNTIRNNITSCVNSKQINEQVGYAMLSFRGNNDFVRDTKIYKETVNIGRAQDNDIVISNQTVSRNQCLIIKKGEKFYICDVSSTNKTLLNGLPVNNTCEIKYGDIVEIGEVMFRFNDVIETI